MKQFLDRHSVAITLSVAALLLISVGLTIYLVTRVSDLSTRLDETNAELEQVAGGAAIVVSQAFALQEQLGTLAPLVETSLDEAVVGLQTFRSSSITFDVAINETIPIRTEFAFARTLRIPVNTVIPIDEVIDTTIRVNGPFGVNIPLNITVPIKLDLPVDLEFPFTVDERIPISIDIPVNLSVPIVVDVEGTELANLADSLGSGLAALKDALGALG